MHKHLTIIEKKMKTKGKTTLARMAEGNRPIVNYPRVCISTMVRKWL
jgi:hypothetical protein